MEIDMRNVYDIARELAYSLKETDQYKNYVAAKERVDANEERAKMVKDLQEKSLELQTQMMLGQDNVSNEMLEPIQKLYAVASTDPVVAEFFAAEMAYTQVVTDIYGILGEAVRIEK